MNFWEGKKKKRAFEHVHNVAQSHATSMLFIFLGLESI